MKINTRSGIEVVITGLTRNQSSVLEADQREPLEIHGISGHKGFGKSLISLLYISPISGGVMREKIAWSGIEEVITAPTRNRVSP